MSHVPTAIDALHRAHPERDFLLFSASISRNQHHDLSMLIAKCRKNAKCTVFLTTRGGDPDAAFRVARCLQHHYQHIRLVIPSHCKSAGTLIAIGAHELAIGDLGELGPIDMQVLKPSELQERVSGLDAIQAIEAIEAHVRAAFHKTLMDIRRGSGLSTRIAGQFAAKIATGMAQPLYSQIDPNRLGELRRVMRIAQEYGFRLNQTSRALCPGALETLIGAYPSHGFVIDRKEARELFKNIQTPTTEESAICDLFWKFLSEESGQKPRFINHDGDDNEESIGNAVSPHTAATGRGDPTHDGSNDCRGK